MRAIQVDHRKLLCVGHCYKIFITLLPQKILSMKTAREVKVKIILESFLTHILHQSRLINNSFKSEAR